MTDPKIPDWKPEDFVKWRADMGLTQDEAAKKLGYRNRASICNLERGVAIITPRIVMSCMVLTASQ